MVTVGEIVSGAELASLVEPARGYLSSRVERYQRNIFPGKRRSGLFAIEVKDHENIFLNFISKFSLPNSHLKIVKLTKLDQLLDIFYPWKNGI